ncbi:MAG TPA: MFS transporter [Mycobacteriales bacterium]|nr:MFS transporter [Mycobacteriales bacterium]
MTAPPVAVPLARNRNYQLLWGSQVLSELGFHASAIAFPLLVLAVTGSAAASGLVLGTIAIAQLLAGLPAGALVDRWHRKRIMLGCEAAQATAAASLVGALVWGTASMPHMVAVAAVIGVCAALFAPAEEASLPSLVSGEQLGTALAMNSARASLGQLTGTAAGGFLFALGRSVPFAVDAITHTMAFVGLAFLRVPRREVPPAPARHLGREIATGLRWVWEHRHIRVMLLCAVVLNLSFSAFYLIIIVLAQARGVPAGEIGIMAAMLGVGGVLGALAAPYLSRVVSPYVSIIMVFWVVTVLAPVALVVYDGYLMGLLFAAMMFLVPAANTTIMTQQLLLTPDELRGRLASVMGVVGGVAAAAGPALGGLLMQAVTDRPAVLLCAGGMALAAVLATASPTLRGFPWHRATADAPPVGPPSSPTRAHGPDPGLSTVSTESSTERSWRDG